MASQEDNEKIVFFDEFAVYDRPSTYYGWAEKNSRPQVPSNEKRRRNKLNGMLCVDVITGKEYFQLKENSKTEDVSSYLAELIRESVGQGFEKISIILDNNSTHKKKMQAQLESHLKKFSIADKISVEFIYTPPYSPDFNLVEYVIHLLRLQLLHHLPIDINIQQIQEKLSTYFQKFQLLTPEKILNIIRHIYSLVI